ncbi:MAG: hypothetical protein WD096_08375 [Actinomycetota bacterium]
MGMLAEFLPRFDGILPVIFFIALTLATGAVGVFALFVIVQQFRNPKRAP